MATPNTKLKAGGRISTSQKVLSLIMCFPTSIRKVRKQEWTQGENEKEMPKENTPKLGTEAGGLLPTELITI